MAIVEAGQHQPSAEVDPLRRRTGPGFGVAVAADEQDPVAGERDRLGPAAGGVDRVDPAVEEDAFGGGMVGPARAGDEEGKGEERKRAERQPERRNSTGRPTY
ncbi:MAG: hypothetical protein R2862_10345 [Thermoanaerobaculia bacterium]